MSMSESKRKRQTNLWALNLSRPNDPLLIVLEHEAKQNPTKYIRPDKTINKSRIIHDLAVLSLRQLSKQRGDKLSLRLLGEHERFIKMNSIAGVIEIIEQARSEHKSLPVLLKELKGMNVNGKSIAVSLNRK